ncbi:MAG: orotate phosphoribosyltransferase [Methylobacterium sp.]
MSAFAAHEHARDVIAESLVRVGAVRVATDKPFVYTSGWASPVYVDTRLLMSDVALARSAMNRAAALLREATATSGINAVIGAESSGIAFAAWIAERLELPLLYLRKRPLGWGNAARVEGRLPPDPRSLYVDDVTTDARSKVGAVTALRESGARTDDVFVLVDFGVYPQSRERLAQNGITLHAMTDWRALFVALRAAGVLAPDVEETLAAFTRDPVAWSLAHGGAGA